MSTFPIIYEFIVDKVFGENQRRQKQLLHKKIIKESHYNVQSWFCFVLLNLPSNTHWQRPPDSNTNSRKRSSTGRAKTEDHKSTTTKLANDVVTTFE